MNNPWKDAVEAMLSGSEVSPLGKALYHAIQISTEEHLKENPPPVVRIRSLSGGESLWVEPIFEDEIFTGSEVDGLPKGLVEQLSPGGSLRTYWLIPMEEE